MKKIIANNDNMTNLTFPERHSLPLSLPVRVKNNPKIRASFHAFRKGSFALEAAMAFPLFFMAAICMISVMNVYGQTIEKMSALRDATELTASAAGSADDEQWIDVSEPYLFHPFFMPKGVGGYTVSCRGRVRVWNGRSENETQSGSSDAQEIYVYVTENGTVYHTDPHCSHIELSISSTDYGELESRRNSSGSKYKPCEKCTSGEEHSGRYYITEDGDRYHTDPDCSGLKRTVRLVPLSQVGGLPECSGCAARKAS